MRETALSNLDKTFIIDGLKDSKRLDGRLLADRRPISLRFGRKFGTAHVTLGNTHVSAHVSGSLVEPSASRPSEGMLRVFVEFSPMCAPRFESGGGRQANEEEQVEINRVMERCLKESRCLDMESLCVVSEEKVWAIRLDLRVLNHDGNATDACSVAGLAALCHYRRPDVSLKGDQITVHPASERDPVPLAVHHHPICSTFAFFNVQSTTDSKPDRVVCVDPSWQEESLMDGKIVFGVNPYREICTLHLAGNMLIDKTVVLRYASTSANHAKTVVELIKNRLSSDSDARKQESDANAMQPLSEHVTKVGLAHAFREEGILSSSEAARELSLGEAMAKLRKEKEDEMKKKNGGDNDDVMEVVTSPDGVVELLPSNTLPAEDDGDSGDISVVGTVSAAPGVKKRVEEICLDDSEEEEEEAVKVGGMDLT